ncbi:MAG: ATP-dependent Clp protease proteolytic subunit [Microcoleus anatoxicus]|uniref:ATP-dependent Clp protease proteolytic subunit n=1 Tax=Microcoleus anatoxicus PTRS2 TaxID=2705321 RepID=A0ABU8YH03_9CYAN|nr:MAG: ATP-dependent Clp protease proteolytic subunit [Oscillatoriales cyanobacterium]TAD98186.1 MAG: ATP-dependent Clp protease proteolytic subunit [Oscillatoriales cyanobacterium]TAE06601.1 MAG: ATP-dependent Clp protease proteolytic subunit [Oscillatoriales cyanobacterium]
MPVDEILRVPYNIPGSSNWQWINIYTRLSQERIIFVNQTITTGLANTVISAMLYLDSIESKKPIYLYINSYGDPIAGGTVNQMAGMMSVAAGLAIYDTMQHIKSEIQTICLGQAIGLSALLLSSGSKGKRASLPHATIAMEYPQGGTQGQATDITINATEVLAKKDLILEIFAKNTGQSVEKLAKDMNRTFYLTPQAAKDYGLIDRVLESTKEISQPTATVFS